MNLPLEQLPEEIKRRLRRNIAFARQFVWIEDSSIQALASYAEIAG